MKLKRIIIDNVKSISHVDSSFPSNIDSFTIFGENGSGKTTFLECISLLGHLSVMKLVSCQSLDARRIVYKEYPSILETVLKRNNCDALCNNRYDLKQAFDDYSTRFNSYMPESESYFDKGEPATVPDSERLVKGEGEDVLLSAYRDLLDPRDKQRRYSLVFYEIEYNKKSISLIIRIDSQTLDLTRILSREISDQEMAKYFRLYFNDESFESKEFILHSSYLRPHALHFGDHPLQIPRFDDWGYEDSFLGVVSYVNTDLNDFGKGNDLRESPKNIPMDFGGIVDRLSIPFDEAGNLKMLDKGNESQLSLNGVLTQVLNRAENPYWDITKFTHNENGTILEVKDIFDKPQRRDVLSSGENEVFFIFLVLLSLPLSNGILILDEPVFHASPITARLFYNQIYKLCGKLSIQLFICSHNTWSLPSEVNPRSAFLVPPNNATKEHRLLDDLDTKVRLKSSQAEMLEEMSKLVYGAEEWIKRKAKDRVDEVNERIDKYVRSEEDVGIGLILAVVSILVTIIIALITPNLPNAAFISFCFVAVFVIFILYKDIKNRVRRIKQQREVVITEITEKEYPHSDPKSLERTLYLDELNNRTSQYLLYRLKNAGFPLFQFAIPNVDTPFWKTVTFTIGHFVIALLLVRLLSGSWFVGGAVAIIEPLLNSFWHYFNERAWGKRNPAHTSGNEGHSSG